jgi:hypothetical protein
MLSYSGSKQHTLTTHNLTCTRAWLCQWPLFSTAALGQLRFAATHKRTCRNRSGLLSTMRAVSLMQPLPANAAHAVANNTATNPHQPSLNSRTQDTQPHKRDKPDG